MFFVHAKILLIDPLSDDPLVCSGSANFSTNSLTTNDENMLLIRGDTRVADIYMTELDRIFRHFRARDIINNAATAGQKQDWLLLDTTDNWIGSNFQDGTYKNNRRLLFFPAGTPARPWSVLAGGDPDPFADEAARAAKVRSGKNAKAKARKAAGSATDTSSAATTKKTGAKKKARTPAKTANKTAKPAKTTAKPAKKKKTSKKTVKKKKTSKKAATSKKKKAGKRSQGATRKTASKRKKKSTAKKRR